MGHVSNPLAVQITVMSMVDRFVKHMRRHTDVLHAGLGLPDIDGRKAHGKSSIAGLQDVCVRNGIFDNFEPAKLTGEHADNLDIAAVFTMAVTTVDHPEDEFSGLCVFAHYTDF